MQRIRFDQIEQSNPYLSGSRDGTFDNKRSHQEESINAYQLFGSLAESQKHTGQALRPILNRKLLKSQTNRFRRVNNSVGGGEKHVVFGLPLPQLRDKIVKPEKQSEQTIWTSKFGTGQPRENPSAGDPFSKNFALTSRRGTDSRASREESVESFQKKKIQRLETLTQRLVTALPQEYSATQKLTSFGGRSIFLESTQQTSAGIHTPFEVRSPALLSRQSVTKPDSSILPRQSNDSTHQTTSYYEDIWNQINHSRCNQTTPDPLQSILNTQSFNIKDRLESHPEVNLTEEDTLFILPPAWGASQQLKPTYEQFVLKNGPRVGAVPREQTMSLQVAATAHEQAEKCELARAVGRQLPVFHKHKLNPWKPSIGRKVKEPEHPPHMPITYHRDKYHGALLHRELQLKNAIDAQIARFDDFDKNEEEQEKNTKPIQTDENERNQVNGQSVLKSLDELEFGFRESLQGGCRDCKKVSMPTSMVNQMRNDPILLERIVKFRAWIKEAKLYNDEKAEREKFEKELKTLGKRATAYLPERAHISKLFWLKYNQPMKPPPTKQELELARLAKLSQEKYELFKKQAAEAEERRQYKLWSERMWATFHANNKRKLEEARRNIIEKYDDVGHELLEDQREGYKKAAMNEVQEKESMWKDELNQGETRPQLQKLLLKHGVSEDEFIEALILVQEEGCVQAKYFEDIQDLSMPETLEKPTILLNKTTVKKVKEREAKRDSQVLDILMGVRRREEFYQGKMKKIFKPQNIEETGDPATEFAKACHKNSGLPLVSIPNQDQGSSKFHSLVQIDCSLPVGVAASLKGIVRNIGVPLKQMFFFNNNLSGEELTSILLCPRQDQFKQVRSIIYGKNELTSGAYECLKTNYLSKRPPHALHELKLVDVNYDESDLVRRLLSDLELDLKLQSLSLSRVPLGSRSVEHLTKILAKKAPCLKEIDLSWNNIPAAKLSSIFVALKGNQYLKSVSFAFNPVSKQDKLRELGNFVRQNTSLQQIDLSGVLQTEKQVQRIVKKAKKALSLLSLHLSHTPCIQKASRILNYITLKLKAKNLLKSEYHKPEAGQVPTSVNWLNKYEIVQRSKAQARDMLYYQRQKIEPAGSNSSQNLILQRTLAHYELPSNKSWFMRDECYVCSRWKYTVFVSQHQGCVEGNFQLLDDSEAELIDIREFTQKVLEIKKKPEADFPSYFKLLPEKRRSELEKQPIKMQKAQEKFAKRELQLYSEYNLWYRVLQEKMLVKDFQVIHLDDGYNFDFGEYAQKQEAGEDPKLYIYAGYLRPTLGMLRCKLKGKTFSDSSPVFVPEIRKESVPLFRLPVTEEEEPPFDLDKSVFKGLGLDTEASLRLALKADLGHWKMNKFVKDQVDQERCIAIISDNFAPLKEMYVDLISCSDYPHVGPVDFGVFCTEVGILDDTIPTSAVDTMFIATKFGAPEEGPGNALFRHEFLEIMLRIAYAKYTETLGKTKRYSDALKMMLEDMIPKWKPRMEWGNFRKEDLWTTEVDQIYRANLDILQEVHEDVFPRYQVDGLRNVIGLICRDSQVELADTEVTYLYGMSKMTVRDEVTQHSEYDKLRFPEFLEFLGRVAHLDFLGDDETAFPEKLECTLDNIFPVYKFKRRSAEAEVEDDTSDESLKNF